MALLQRVTLFDWHLFQTFAAVAHMTRSSEIFRKRKEQTERIVTLSAGLLLNILLTCVVVE